MCSFVNRCHTLFFSEWCTRLNQWTFFPLLEKQVQVLYIDLCFAGRILCVHIHYLWFFCNFIVYSLFQICTVFPKQFLFKYNIYVYIICKLERSVKQVGSLPYFFNFANFVSKQDNKILKKELKVLKKGII